MKLLIFSLCCSAIWPVSAAPENPPVLREPIVGPVPERAQWTIDYSQNFPDDWDSEDSWESQGGQIAGAQEARHVRKLEIDKDARLQSRQITTRWTDGKKEEEWIIMGQHVAERDDGSLYIVGAERLTAGEYEASDFPELSWIAREHFVGVREHKGRPVFAFEVDFDKKLMTPTEARRYQFARQADPEATPSDVFQPRFDQVTAYLDAVTQRPVLYNDGSTLRTYSFKLSGLSQLRPPRRLIEFVVRRNEALEARISVPQGPGASGD